MTTARSHRPHRCGRSRFEIVGLLALVALGSFLVTRTVLVVISPAAADLSPLALLRAYGVGVIYDLASYAYALIPVVLYLLVLPNRLWRTRANAVLVHVASFASVYGLLFVAVAEVLFWNEFQVRFNFISVDYLVYRREVADNIAQSYPVGVLLGLILVVTAVVYWRLLPHIRLALAQRDTLRRRAALALALWALPLMGYLLLDEALAEVPGNTYQTELARSGPYQFFAAFRNNELDYFQFYRTTEAAVADTILRAEVKEVNSDFLSEQPYDIRRRVFASGQARKLNVMLVMVESLSARYLGVYGSQQRLTPNLDRLAEQSVLFTQFYATGTRTTRGLEAVTLSIPPTPGRSIVKRIGRESGMWSLGHVLSEKGYDVCFLYGGRGYFDNMNAFFSGNGYRIVDQSSVAPEEIGFENAWGMADEYLYSQAIEQADAAFARSQPFFFHLMTTSNHRPYTYPDNRIDIASGSGRDGAVKYTDWAIGDFLARARQRPWFDDTIFVFVADHTAGSAGKTDLPIDQYHIPLLIFSPAWLAPARVDTITSQIDVAPTLLALLHMDYPSAFFGKNALAMGPGQGRALIGNYQHLGFYTRGKLSIASPRQRLSQQLDPESGNPQVQQVGTDDPHMQRALAYYQGASYIYRHHLNAWNGDTAHRFAKHQAGPAAGG